MAKKNIRRKTVFSTGDIASMLGVSTTTIRRWAADDHDMPYIALPGGGMQVYRQHVQAFLDKKGVELEEIEELYHDACELRKSKEYEDENDLLAPQEEHSAADDEEFLVFAEAEVIVETKE